VIRVTRRRLVCLAVAAIAAPGLPAIQAQESATDYLRFLEGLVSANARRYMSAPPDFPGATPATTSVTFMEATVLEFESAEMAEHAGRLLEDDMALSMVTGIAGVRLDDFEDAGLGDRSGLLVAPDDDEFRSVLFVFDGNLAFVVTARGTDDTIGETLLAFGEFMVEAEPGGEVVLAGEGQSSGGTWDTLPTFDDTGVLAGLYPIYDYDLLVSNRPIEPEATPAT
jgi:hypothetical protein